MASLWALGGLSWKELGTRIYREIGKDDVFGRAAQLAYYFLLALFPLLLFLTTLFGYFADSGSELRTNLLNYLGTVVPSSAASLINKTIEGMNENASSGKISFGILATLWAASNGMGAITEALNVAYNVQESRSFLRRRLTAALLTVCLALLILTALILMLYGGRIAETIATSFGMGDLFTITWKIAQWPIILAFVLLTFASIYYFAPDLREQKFAWISPGAVIGVVLWLLVSFGFRLYLHFFNTYSATYGSLGAVIILMLWFYLTGAAILIGGEINSEIENAAAKAGHPEAKEKGEKAPEQKNPTRSKNSATSKNGDQQASSATATAVGAPARQTAGGKRRGKLTIGQVIVALVSFALSSLRGKRTNRMD